MVPISEVLHALIPALLVPEIDQLFEQHRTVLTGDRRYGAIRGTAAAHLVTRRTGPKKLRTVFGIRGQLCRFQKFLSRGRRTCRRRTDGARGHAERGSADQDSSRYAD